METFVIIFSLSLILTIFFWLVIFGWRREKQASVFFNKYIEGEINAFEVMLSKEIDVNIKVEGMTALLLACGNWDVETAKFLISKWANPNLQWKKGIAPLLVSYSNTDIIRLLLEKGANPNIRENQRWITPIFNTVSVGNIEWTKLLLKAGADPNMIENGMGHSPIYCAFMLQSEEGDKIIKELLKAGANVNVPTVFWITVAELLETRQGIKNVV